MSVLGNLLWLVFGGVFFGLSWLLAGVFLCCTIVGIPFGIACFRFSVFAFLPFGRELVPAEWLGEKPLAGTGCMSILWILFVGVWNMIAFAVAGILCCITIIGIPFGLACFNLARASLNPLGKRVVTTAEAQALRQKIMTGGQPTIQVNIQQSQPQA